MGIRVLGPLTVDHARELGRRDRVVLTALATNPGRPVNADQLSDALWGEHPPVSGPKILQGCVVRLRKVLGRDAVETSAQGYALRLPAEEVDSLRFEERIGRARELLTLGEPDRAAYLLTEALDLWRGEPFTDLEGWVPAATVRRRLSELRLEAEELRVDALLRAGRFREVLSDAQALVREAPLRELRWGLLARAQYQSGQQGEALRTIRQLRTILVEQLGIDPGPDMLALESSILRQDASLMVADARSAPTTCPWPGLRAYDVEDADRFFGRERDVEACLDILARSPVLALVGPSGSGKSSLLRAGVEAALRRRGRPSVMIVPGAHPLDALTTLYPAPPGAALLVDQFEELFSLCRDPGVHAEFLRCVVTEADHRSVVVALRADHLADLAGHSCFSRLVERGMYLVGGLDEEGLRSAVETPARQTGLVIEPGLVDLLVREVGNDPGALPLMSHALLETWKRRQGSTLTVAGYQATGGINGAVAQSAEDLYSRVGVAQRRLLRDLVLRLVSPGPQGEPVRTRVPRRLVGTDPEQERLIDMLVTARLVTSDDGALEITHEALTRAWPRMRGWLDDDVEGQRIRHHLSAAADAWDALGRPESELYRGVRLGRTLDWRADSGTPLTMNEVEFLGASSRLAETEAQSIVEQARAQARLIRRLRTALTGAAALVVLTLIVGGIATVQSNRAGRNAAEARSADDNARRAALAKDARQIGARAETTEDISLSLLLAAAGVRLDDSPETRVNLVAALGRNPRLVRSAPPAGGYLESLEVSPDGRWIASSDDRNRMHLYDAATYRLLGSYDAGQPAEGTQAFSLPAFSPDSRQLAIVLELPSKDPVRLLDPSTMHLKRSLTIPGVESGYGVDAQFSADGRYLAATVFWGEHITAEDTPGYVAVWDLRSPARPPSRLRIAGRQGLALSPDGRTVYTGVPLTAYDVASRQMLWRRPRVKAFILSVNPDGTMLARSDDGTTDAYLVDAASGQTVRRLPGHHGNVWVARFSADGRVLGTISDDGEIIIRESGSGRISERWDTFDPWSLGFSPDSNLVYGGAADSMLRTWDRSTQQTYLRRTTKVGDSREFLHADLSPDGSRVAYRWLDDRGIGWVRFVDTATGARTAPTRLTVQDYVFSLGSWSPDGRRYAAWCMEECREMGSVTVLDTTTGEAVTSAAVLDTDIYSVTYVDGGRRLLVGDNTDPGRTHLLDAESLRPRRAPLAVAADSSVALGTGAEALVSENRRDMKSERWRLLDVRTGEVRSQHDVGLVATIATAAPDGSAIAVGGAAGEIATIDLSTGAQRRSTSAGELVRWVSYSDDGELLVSAADDGAVSLWDARTLDLLGTVSAPRPGDPVPAGAQFIGDSHDVAIASYDGTVYRWETDLERALDFALSDGRARPHAPGVGAVPARPALSVRLPRRMTSRRRVRGHDPATTR